MKSIGIVPRTLLLIVFPLILELSVVGLACKLLLDAQAELLASKANSEAIMKLHQFTWDCLEDVMFFDAGGSKNPAQTAINETERHVVEERFNFRLIEVDVGPKAAQLVDGIKQEAHKISDVVGWAIKQQSKGATVGAPSKMEMYKKVLGAAPQLINEINRLITFHESARRQLAQKSIDTKNKLFWLMGAGTLVSIISAIVLGLVYSRGITTPLERLVENSARLGRGEQLLEPIGKDDELGRLDVLMHRVSDELSAARALESSLVSHAGEMICALDKNGIFLEVNEAGFDILKINPAEIVGRNINEFASAGDSFIADEYIRRVSSSGQEETIELALITPDGNICNSQWSCFWSDSEEQTFCVVRDITLEKAAEKLKQDFADMISHDMRSPLAATLICCELLSTAHSKVLSERILEEIDSVKSNVEFLHHLVDDIMDYQKLETGNVELSLSSFSTEQLINDVIALIDDLADTKELSVVKSIEDLTLIADRTKLMQALTNLLSNAIKFSPTGGSIEMKVARGISASKQDTVEFAIKDEGPGIPAEMLTSIFEPFEQVPSTSKEGTGLGLAICKQIANLHGGDILARNNACEGSEGARGCTILVTIPLRRSQG